jgi:hypothetical protein
MLYRPKININFGKDERFQLYHCEGGEGLIANMTRLNVVFIVGNSVLLLLELISPCMGMLLMNVLYSLWVLAWYIVVCDFGGIIYGVSHVKLLFY